MTDLILISALVSLLALARGYVWACARLTDEREPDSTARLPQGAAVDALTPLPLIASIGAGDGAALVLAVGLLVYLMVTLLAPERFR